MGTNMRYYGDIRTQLIKQGVKESPKAMVERLWTKFQELEVKIKATSKKWALIRLRDEASLIQAKIVKVCADRKIGNPLLGQPIEYESEYKRQVGQVK